MSHKKGSHGHHHHHHHHHDEDEDQYKEPRWSPRGIMAMATMFPLAVGPGTAHTPEAKLKVLKIAAGRDKGKSCGKAWYRLGKAHLEGEGCPKDRRQALHCFEMAAERHNVNGALEAGKLLFEGGSGFRVNKDRSRFFFKLAAEGGVPDAQRRLGELNLASPDKAHSETLQFFLDAFTSNPIVNAAAGMAAARMLAACMTSEQPDYLQAVRLLEKAADAGSHGPARLRLAVMYELGVGGVEIDPVKARAYWKLAIISDVPEAHYRVAILALHGAGFVKSERAAVNGYRRAAKLGFLPEAAVKLVELRGENALKDIEGRRNPPPDFVDIKFHQTSLYPYPYYDDEKEQEEKESCEAEENYKQARNAKKEALVKAMMVGGQRAVDRLNKEHEAVQNKEKAFKLASNWQLPPILVTHLLLEREQLMSCVDTYLHHMPTRYEPPLPPAEDKVSKFYRNMGISRLGNLATIPLKDTLVGLNGEGLGEYAHGGGNEGLKNDIYEEQILDKKLGLLRKTAKILSSNKPIKVKGHSNLLEGVESKMYSTNSRPHHMFLSSGAKEILNLKKGRAKTASYEKQCELDTLAVMEIAKGSNSKQVMGNRRIANMLAASKDEAQGGKVEHDDDEDGYSEENDAFPLPDTQKFTPYAKPYSRSSSSRGGGGGSDYGGDGATSVSEYAPPIRRASTAHSLQRSDGGYSQHSEKQIKDEGKVSQLPKRKAKLKDDVPAWMNDSVWMAQPNTDSSLFRAVELRKNYGAPPRLGTAPNKKGSGGRHHHGKKPGDNKTGKRSSSRGSVSRNGSSYGGSKTEGAYSEYGGTSSVYSSSCRGSSRNTSRSGY